MSVQVELPGSQNTGSAAGAMAVAEGSELTTSDRVAGSECRLVLEVGADSVH
mgnify:CR=1 FL=1